MLLSDYAEERIAKRKAINARNKRRGREMEQRIMKALGGKRVPMSGAGSIKGDGQIYSERYGYVVVECKCSEARNSDGYPKVTVALHWLPKLEKDVEVMNATLGFLVFNFHGKRSDADYVIVRQDWFQRLFKPVLDPECSDVPYTIEVKTKTWGALHHKLSEWFKQHSEIHLHTDYGVYVVIPFDMVQEAFTG